MPVTITFNKISEKVPSHGQLIIWLEKTSSIFGYEEFCPQEITAEYQWTEIDSEGYDTGNAACFDPETEMQYKWLGMMQTGECTWRLDIILTGSHAYHAEEDDLWIDVEEYWKCFEENK